MKIKERALSLLLSLVMVLAFTPVITFAGAGSTKGDAGDPQLVPEVLWAGCEYYSSADFDADMDNAALISVTSSKPSVIKVHITGGSGMDDYYLEPLRAGTSVITVTYSTGGVQKSASAEFTVKPFPVFANSLTVDGGAVDLAAYKNYYQQYNYTGTAPIIKYTLAQGWEIVDGYYYLDDGSDDFDGYSGIDAEDLQKIGDGLTLAFSEDYTALRAFFDFRNASGETIMHSVQLERGDGYDPGWEEEDGLYVETVWVDCSYGTYINLMGNLCDAEITSAVSSDPETITVNETSWGGFYLLAKKPGTSTITVTYELDGETGTESAEFTAKAFPNFIKSLKIDGKEAGASPLKNYYYVEKYTGTSPKIEYVPAEGWKIISAYWYDGDNYINIDVDDYLSEPVFDFPETASDAELELEFINQSGETIRHAVRLERSGSGDDPDTHEHEWSGYSYVWSADNKSVDASCECDVCHEEETEKATVVEKVTKDPTCTDKGETTYTATFTKDCFETQTKSLENINALGHDWDEGTITKRATATEPGVITYTCKRDPDHKMTETIAPLEEDSAANKAAKDAAAAAETAIKSGTDAEVDEALASAKTAAGEAVETAEQKLKDAQALGDQAQINAAKQDLADATATQKKVEAVAARTSAKKAASSAAAKQSAAAAQAAAGTDAAVNAAYDAVIAANSAQKEAQAACEAAQEALAAAKASGDEDAITAATNALRDAETVLRAANNAVNTANSTYGSAVNARNAAIAAAQTPAENIDLPAVKISKPKAAKKKVTVKWTKVSKANLKKISGIQIQVATDPGFSNIVKTATVGKKKTSKVIKGLQSKTKYYVRIRAISGNHVSAWSVMKSVKVK